MIKQGADPMKTDHRMRNVERQAEAIRFDRRMEEQQNWLQEYEGMKFELAGLIREANSAAWQAKEESLQRELQGLLKRLAEDRFYLTVVGQFNRGKTTLINAMLGMDRLPTGVVPITSVITAVGYNARERVVMHFENSNLTHEVSLSELPEWITEQGNPGNRRNIEMAEVQLPAEILRRGAFFVDTPGLGSAVVENSETTHRFLPYIDALVLVTSFEFPLSQEEILFLRKARERCRTIFIVINKLDLCTASQQIDVLGFIRTRLAQETGLDQIPLFGVSTREALGGKLKRDSDRLERSGLPDFERELVKYLVTDRSHDFLTAACDRIESLFKSHKVPALKNLEGRLEGIRARVGGGRDRTKNDTIDVLLGAEWESRAERSLKISSCFLCQRMAETTFKFMSRFQYELSHSLKEQLFHASRSGFCALHSREYSRLASPQGIASGYPKTLLFVSGRLRSLSCDGGLRDDWKEKYEQLVPDHHKCRACQVVAETETEMTNDFVREYGNGQPHIENDLPCVCLRHLQAILEAAPDTEFANRILLRSATVLEYTAENMERYALRHGGRHMELVTREELESPEKGLNLLVGQPSVRPLEGR
jgi:GTP-binding protein EngB required for normal cell division